VLFFEIERSSCKQKYRDASKNGHRGEIKNIVVSQKVGIAVKTKYRVQIGIGIVLASRT